MVKHQRRSHQRGLHPNEILDDCTSDSDSGESPSTPKHTGMTWPPQAVMQGGHPGMPHGHSMHRAASFADFGQHMNTYNMQQQYGHRHSLSSGGAHEFHGQPVHEQHNGVQMIHRSASISQHPYYVTEHGNPGVATMNTNPVPPQYQVPRQQVERLPLEIPYTAPGLNASIQSSPSSFSAASGRSPSTQDGFYTHQPTQAATYALHSASPVEQHPQGMVAYPQQMQQSISQQPINTQHQIPSQAPQQQAAPTADQYQHQAPHAEPEQWYHSVAAYQPPVEVATIGQLPTYGSTAVYDPWGPKMEFEDPSIQLPSARIENM
jgi:metal regulatory transcription factor 1